jgi:2,3-bisphosphoglycerate-independent phosphoglycerate mutase
MSKFALKKNGFTPRRGPVVIVVLDGVGVAPAGEGNAVALASMPTLKGIWANSLTAELKAHGKAVGLPSDGDMGNSEVGHNALGSGRVFDQGAKLVDNAIADGSLYRGEVWQAIIASAVANDRPVHFIGLLSDGNVHSHIDQLVAMVRKADDQGVKRLYLHPLLDGRDVPAQSALKYLEQVEAVFTEINAKGERDFSIASGGGRMLVTMDRYEADWRIVERGWKTHVLGEGRGFASAREAVEAFRLEDPELGDQFLPPFVIHREGKAVAPIEDGDGVVFFNFRGDRAIEISRAFEEEDFDAFERQRFPKVNFSGMMEYDGDAKIPSKYLVSPPCIENTMGEYLAQNAIAQFACSETQKFGHVTYFWNGNRSGMFDEKFETYVEVTSDLIPFEQRPWMKAAEITDATIAGLRDDPNIRFARLNYANGDMVGHTGDLQATIVGLEAVDLCLARLLKFVAAQDGVVLITADHGNADEMYQFKKKTKDIARNEEGKALARTSHTLNAVPFSIVDPRSQGEYEWDTSIEEPQLAHVAATALWLMGYEAPEGFYPSLIRES